MAQKVTSQKKAVKPRKSAPPPAKSRKLRKSASASAYAMAARAVVGIGPAGAKSLEAAAAPTPDVALKHARTALKQSAALNKDGAKRMRSRSARVRAEAELQLLAKAATDLQLAESLAAGQGALERALLPPSLPFLDIVERGTPKSASNKSAGSKGGAVVLGSVAEARSMLEGDLRTLVDDVRTGVRDVAQKVMDALLAMGASSLLRGAADVTLQVAKWVNVGDKVSLLFDTIKGFFARAYEAIVGVIGQPLLNMGIQRALDWMEDLKTKRIAMFDDLLNRVYGLPKLHQDLTAIVTSAKDDLPRMGKAVTGIDALSAGFGKRMNIINKYALNAMKLASLLPPLQTPAGMLAQATLLALTLAATVWIGGDFLDAVGEQARVLNHVDGARTVLKTALG